MAKNLADIPPEILIAIFIASLDPLPEFCDLQHSPWLPAQVCRQWRQTVQGTPALWSNLLLYGPEKEEGYASDLDRIQFCLKTFLLHSKDYPLRIKLIRRQRWGTPTLEFLLGTLWAHRARWETFHLGLDRSNIDHWLYWAQQEPSKTMPMLRSLSLGPMTSLDRRSSKRLTSLFYDTPALQNLSLRAVQSVDIPVTPTQDWSSLRSVVLEDCQAFEHRLSQRFLTACAHITALRLTSSSLHNPTAIECHYTFPNLQALTILGPRENELMRHLTAPQLQVLELNGDVSGDVLSSFITRSQLASGGICHIEHLTVLCPRRLSWQAETTLSMSKLRILDLRHVVVSIGSKILESIDYANFTSLRAIQLNMWDSHDASGKFHVGVVSIVDFLTRRFLTYLNSPVDEALENPTPRHLKGGTHLRFSFTYLDDSDHTKRALDDLQGVVRRARVASGGTLDVDVGIEVEDHARAKQYGTYIKSCLGQEWTPFSPSICNARRRMEDVEKELDEEKGSPGTS